MKKVFITVLMMIIMASLITCQVFADDDEKKLELTKTTPYNLRPEPKPFRLWVPVPPKYNLNNPPKYTPNPTPPCPSGSGCVFPQ